MKGHTCYTLAQIPLCMYEIEIDMYEDLCMHTHYLVDHSKFYAKHPNFNVSDKKGPGKFKDETTGVPIKAFHGH